MSFTVAVGLYSACEAGAVFGDAQELHRSNKAPIKVKVQNVLIESSENRSNTWRIIRSIVDQPLGREHEIKTGSTSPCRLCRSPSVLRENSRSDNSPYLTPRSYRARFLQRFTH